MGLAFHDLGPDGVEARQVIPQEPQGVPGER
jgi:hypothetical protein